MLPKKEHGKTCQFVGMAIVQAPSIIYEYDSTLNYGEYTRWRILNPAVVHVFLIRGPQLSAHYVG